MHLWWLGVEVPFANKWAGATKTNKKVLVQLSGILICFLFFTHFLTPLWNLGGWFSMVCNEGWKILGCKFVFILYLYYTVISFLFFFFFSMAESWACDFSFFCFFGWHEKCESMWWFGRLIVRRGKNFNVAIFLDTMIVINVKLYMIVLLMKLYLFILLSVTLTTFQGHRGVKQ